MADNRRDKRPGRMVKDLKVMGDGRPRTYQGKRPSDVVRDVKSQLPEVAKELNPTELRFLANYFETGTFTRAWKKLYPKANDKRCAQMGSTMYKSIETRIGRDAVWEIAGVSYGKIASVISEAMDAEYQKDFVVRDGSITSTPPRKDHPTRLTAVQMAIKLRGLAKDEEKSGPVVVQVISYLGGDVASQRPWPGGGRVVNGRLQDTVGPDSPAARGELPASRVTVDLGDRKNERDD